jgi:hypothetical protein
MWCVAVQRLNDAAHRGRISLSLTLLGGSEGAHSFRVTRNPHEQD